MKTQNIKTNNQKRSYNAPKVEQVKLDNEISMVMMSFPGDPTTMPTQDPLMSLKGFKLFK
jgi:hypothetical protein